MFPRSLTAAAAVLALALPLTLAAGPAGAVAPVTTSADPSLASYDGHTIDLDDGSWDGAGACSSDGRTTQCFDTEAELDAWVASTPTASPAPLSGSSSLVRTAAVLTCSSSLRLYKDGGFGGRVLYLSSRGLWFNLASYGFNNITSSFVVGGCTVYLADGTNGGGSWYPGGYANSVVPVLASGWNDRITSVYVV